MHNDNTLFIYVPNMASFFNVKIHPLTRVNEKGWYNGEGG